MCRWIEKYWSNLDSLWWRYFEQSMEFDRRFLSNIDFLKSDIYWNCLINDICVVGMNGMKTIRKLRGLNKNTNLSQIYGSVTYVKTKWQLIFKFFKACDRWWNICNVWCRVTTTENFTIQWKSGIAVGDYNCKHQTQVQYVNFQLTFIWILRWYQKYWWVIWCLNI